MHSHQVGWFRHDQIRFVNTVIPMSTLLIQPKHVFTRRNLRGNWSNRLEILGMSILSIQVSRKFPFRVDVSKDQRVDVVRLANYANELSGK